MPTSSNAGGSGSACTELDFAFELDANFAMLRAMLNTPCDIAEPDLVEEVFLEPALEATADMPPMAMPESLQEAAADCGVGDAQGEGVGKAPDIVADPDPDLCVCLCSLEGDMAAHPPSLLGVCSLLEGARTSGIMLSMPEFG